MCKSHKFLMITNCDFLSNDIVLARNAFHVESWRWRNEPSRRGGDELYLLTLTPQAPLELKLSRETRLGPSESPSEWWD